MWSGIQLRSGMASRPGALREVGVGSVKGGVELVVFMSKAAPAPTPLAEPGRMWQVTLGPPLKLLP